MLLTALTECKRQLLHKMAGTAERPASKQIEVLFEEETQVNKVSYQNKESCPLNASCSSQTLAELEDSLREFEQRLTELRSRADVLQSDQPSKQELLKLQVTGFS